MENRQSVSKWKIANNQYTKEYCCICNKLNLSDNQWTKLQTDTLHMLGSQLTNKNSDIYLYLHEIKIDFINKSMQPTE